MQKSERSFLPLHHGNLLLGQAVEVVDEAVDFGFKVRHVGAVGGGEDLLYRSMMGACWAAVAGGMGSWAILCFR